MDYLCPLCGNKMATDDSYFYTCLECDQTFTADELAEEFDLNVACPTGGCGTDH